MPRSKIIPVELEEIAMTRAAEGARKHYFGWVDESVHPAPSCSDFVFLLHAGSGSAKKAERTLTTPAGKPVRKVYVDAGTPVMANAATTRLDQDTCLTVVSSPKEADAIWKWESHCLLSAEIQEAAARCFWFAAQGSDTRQCSQQFQKQCLRNLQRWQGRNNRLQVVQFAGRRRGGAAGL